MEVVRRKNQPYFFSKLLTWATSLKVTFSGKYYIFKILTSNVQTMISLNKLIYNLQAYFRCYS